VGIAEDSRDRDATEEASLSRSRADAVPLLGDANAVARRVRRLGRRAQLALVILLE